jgi:hypothetical protein
MWLRNIIWFILLTGIIVFSILLFIMIITPVSAPNYTPSSLSMNTPKIQSETPKQEMVIHQPQKKSSGWATFGHYMGYLPLILWIIPILTFFQSRRSFSFFLKGVLLFLAFASIHGGILLRQTTSNQSVMTGTILYFLFFFFYWYMWSVLSGWRKIHRKKLWLPIGIVSFFIIIHLFF